MEGNQGTRSLDRNAIATLIPWMESRKKCERSE
jgi:hypothetical protein